MRYLITSILLIFSFSVIGCSTAVTEYTYENGKAKAVKRIRISGIGKAEIKEKEYTIESKPWVQVPSLPKINLESLRN